MWPTGHSTCQTATDAAGRDASLALADLEWRTGRRDDAVARYREVEDALPGPVAAFVRRRILEA